MMTTVRSRGLSVDEMSGCTIVEDRAPGGLISINDRENFAAPGLHERCHLLVIGLELRVTKNLRRSGFKGRKPGTVSSNTSV